MTQDEFVKETGRRCNESPQKILSILRVMIELICEEVIKGGTVKFRFFGTFKSKVRRGNISTIRGGEDKYKDVRRMVFLQSRRLKEKMN